MSINWNNHIDRLRSQIADLRSTLRVIKTKAHDERPGLEQTTAQLRELVDKDESQKTLYQFPKILHKILHNPAVGAIVLGPNGEHLLFNTAAERLLGSDLMADALAEKSGNFGFYQTDKVTKYTKEQLPWQQAVLGEQVPEVDLFVRRQGYVDGLWIKATSTALKSETNDIGGAVVFLVDITEQVQVENQIQSTCEALEQQISQIGSAQLELQLLTEKLGKLDYLPEKTPDVVQKASGAVSNQVSDPNFQAVSDMISELVSDPASQAIPDQGLDHVPEVTADTVSEPVIEPVLEPLPALVAEATVDIQTTESATSIHDSSVIDYVSDELAKWTDIDPAMETSGNTVASSAGTESSNKVPAESAPQGSSTANSSPDGFETLEDKAQKVNESIVQQLTSEIFAIANQATLESGAESKPVESKPAESKPADSKPADSIPAEQEFFAPDSNEKEPMAQVSGVPLETEKQPKSSKKAAQKQTEAAETAGSRRRKILIVDDIPVNQKLLRLQLKRLGFECDAANNGDAAQKAIANGDFALVLMDLDMPIMDGFESTAAIRKSEQGLGKRIPIVAMTSYDRQEDREKCLAAGMDDFLSKGATQKQLHEVVERCMRAASNEAPTPQPVSTVPLKETGLDIESLQKQFDKEEVQDVSRLFLSAVNTFIDCIQLGIEEKDAGAVTHFAHSVKGPCAALGIDEMTRLTSEIMSDAEAGNWTQVRVKYMKLKSSFGEVRDQLRDLCTPGYV